MSLSQPTSRQAPLGHAVRRQHLGHQTTRAQQRLPTHTRQQAGHRRHHPRLYITADAIVDMAQRLPRADPAADTQIGGEYPGLLGQHDADLFQAKIMQVLIFVGRPQTTDDPGTVEKRHQRPKQGLAMPRLQAAGLAGVNHEILATAGSPSAHQIGRSGVLDRPLDDRRQPEQTGAGALVVVGRVKTHLRHILDFGAGRADAHPIIGGLGQLHHRLGRGSRHLWVVPLPATATGSHRTFDRRDDHHPLAQAQTAPLARLDAAQKRRQSRQHEHAVQFGFPRIGHQGQLRRSLAWADVVVRQQAFPPQPCGQTGNRIIAQGLTSLTHCRSNRKTALRLYIIKHSSPCRFRVTNSANPSPRVSVTFHRKKRIPTCCNATQIPLYCTATNLLMSDEEYAMVIDLFSKALETPQSLPEPLVKVNKLMVENIEKMMLFQMNSLKAYLDIGINQMRAAAEINDVKSLQSFYKRQTDIAQTVQQKMLHDAKAMSDLATRFKTEMDGLTKTTLEDVLHKAA
ncbi:phasin family protein [Candidatus Competibacter phosphatis]|uniref:Phasin family protein n=2 Tax=Candidatus Competibacter phosphatis TaxID=221280 RepID=A0ABX1TS34_9GAMM|nr:phasin family protein [Candidatus Competibacter phosphatis]